DAVAGGASRHVPLLAGTNHDEMHLFAVFDPTTKDIDDAGLLKRLRASGAGDGLEKALAVYRGERPGHTPAELWMAMGTDWAIRLLEAQLPHQPACWSYLFTERSKAFDGVLGSCHALEIPFVFGTVDRPGVSMFVGDNPNVALSEAMQEEWLAFARTGAVSWD